MEICVQKKIKVIFYVLMSSITKNREVNKSRFSCLKF